MIRLDTVSTREELLRGMKWVSDMVRVTMGPKGRNVAIHTGGMPIFTNDGVTVARSIVLDNKIQNIGASMIKEACEKTNKEAGDGTTTTAVLTYAIANEGLKHINEGINPFLLSKALDIVGKEIISGVRSLGRDLQTKEEVEQIATISSQDPEIGSLIANIIDEVGNDGTITVEEGQTPYTTHEIKKGLQFDTGYISPYMANQEDNSFIGKEINVLITDHRIEQFKQIKPILGKLLKENINTLVLICSDIEGEALASVVLNKVKGVFNLIAIKAPGFGELRNEYLHDIATVTGATVVTTELGMKIEDAELQNLGIISSITATGNSTIITGSVDQESIDKRINKIRADLETATTEYERAKHQERLSKLSGGIAVIKAGASTEIEMKNKKFKIEDALNATKSAIEEGVVIGGGNALLKIAEEKSNEVITQSEQYIKIATDILTTAIRYPAQYIIDNSGYNYDEIKKTTKKDKNFGFDANEGIYKDMIKAGIIDPIKVIRVALENSISSATMLLTTEATITYEEQTK